jgi:hypothetical protein
MGRQHWCQGGTVTDDPFMTVLGGFRTDAYEAVRKIDVISTQRGNFRSSQRTAVG